MADRNTPGSAEQTARLSKISVILSVIAGGLLLALLAALGVTANFQVWQSREAGGLSTVRDYSCREIENADAPIGIVKEYTFRLDEGLEKDTYLAFYTVHQYAEIHIEGQLVYSMKPAAKAIVKTVGSSWTMIPLYREDAGKEIRVELFPAYESFRNREPEFLLGSRLSVCADRLRQDWPQLLLSAMAIFIGLVFICIAVYKLFNRRGDQGLAALGLFSVMMGLWRLTDTRFTPFLVPEKPVLMFYISVAMMMLGVVPLIKSVEGRLNRGSRRILDWYCIAAAAVCIVQLLLQVFGGIDLRQNIQITHLMLASGSLILVGNVIYDRLQYPKTRNDTITAKAPIILVAGVLADIVAFYARGTSSGLLFSLLAVLIYIVITGANMMFHYVEQEKQLAEQSRILARQERSLAENERQLTESRISLLMSQIRPHFIYNTLGSIEQLCELQPEAAAGLVHDFARYLRGNFSELDNPAPIRMCQELEHVRCYVRIEKIRFPDIEVIFDIRSEDSLLPALSVQPLVENAIKHGLMKLPSGGVVTVSAYETDTHHCVCVQDNGGGFDPAHLWEDRSHVGLRNIRERLAAMCGGTLTVKSTPGTGTKVTILIPREGKQ
ncbi:MAG: sensor histidine kinase [Candidatus Limivicinus sp.]